MMTLDDVRNVAHQLKRLRVTEVAYLHLGEPFLSKRLAEELQIIREYNPGIRIHTSTNGMFVRTDEQRKAALLFDHIQFSLDGINQEMADRYQRGIDFGKSFSNMKELVRFRNAHDHRRTHIVWKYLLFRWNESRKYLLTALDMARDAGVDEIWFERTVSPFYGLPWRSYLGFNRDLGIAHGNATHVVLRDEASDPLEAPEPDEEVALVESLA
jgi:MoaA/NifB/PqqE/SkfB family radical SAM enzyme